MLDLCRPIGGLLGRAATGDPLNGRLISARKDGLETEGASGFLSDGGGDSANDSSDGLTKVEVAPNMKALVESAVLGRRVGTLLEDRFFRMPGLMGLNVFRLRLDCQCLHHASGSFCHSQTYSSAGLTCGMRSGCEIGRLS